MSSRYASHSLEQAASLGPGKWESGWKYRLYTIRQTEKLRMAASAVRQPDTGREKRAMMMGMAHWSRSRFKKGGRGVAT